MIEAVESLARGGALHDMIGMVGVAIYLGAYAAMQLGVLKGQTFTFATLNILAPTLVLISLSRNFNLAAAAIQFAWITISAVGIARLVAIRCRNRLAGDEAELAVALVPGLPDHRARILLSLGRHRQAGPGAVLATQDEPVAALTYVISGTCDVERDGMSVTTIGPGSLVGETGYLSGAPASATVRAIGAVRLFSFDAVALRQALSRNPDIAAALERAVAGVLRRRLVTATQELARVRHSLSNVPASDRASTPPSSRDAWDQIPLFSTREVDSDAAAFEKG
jgi:CRP-like cAMP-binding protein